MSSFFSGNLGGLPCIFGSAEPRFYAANGQTGDWETEAINWAPLAFGSDDVVVIANANQSAVPSNANAPAVVAMAWNANRNGFVLATRNSDTSSGTMGFDWLAVDTSPVAGVSPLNMKLLTLSEESFKRSGSSGDWGVWNVPNLQPNSKSMLTLLSASTLPDDCRPVVGVATDIGVVRARNSDTVSGGAASLSCLSVIDTAGGGNYFAQSGTTPLPAGYFLESGNDGASIFNVNFDSDWNRWPIYFPLPFSAPPIVFVTANNIGSGTNNTVAAVGTAVAIRSTGFLLAARNSDISKGFAGFNWLAIGCRGCW